MQRPPEEFATKREESSWLERLVDRSPQSLCRGPLQGSIRGTGVGFVEALPGTVCS